MGGGIAFKRVYPARAYTTVVVLVILVTSVQLSNAKTQFASIQTKDLFLFGPNNGVSFLLLVAWIFISFLNMCFYSTPTCSHSELVCCSWASVSVLLLTAVLYLCLAV